ncbi:hypothetical protein [Paenibacillus sp. LK1]|uniref:hypothetical protein n=1 Tax=Paenibacillus sp. LK1 TaxID=2053014 RepID=UPI000C190EDD|nr:hypothetical protein [Paenibacillus sp. LK1]PIH58267.1 hypothetical protein CS562_17505 [Paenibacillus sp. LK1]
MTDQLEAKYHWEWTEKAVEENKFQRIVAGTPVWDNYKKKAPERWVKEGLIRQAQKPVVPVGQAAFDFDS